MGRQLHLRRFSIDGKSGQLLIEDGERAGVT